VHRRTHDVVYQTARADLLGLMKAGLMKQYRQGNAHVFIARPDLADKLRK
jgi:hypothetical protein